MKTLLRISFAFLCLLLFGVAFLLLASRRHASLIAADQPPQDLAVQATPIFRGPQPPMPVAAKPGQILLHTVVMDIDEKKLAEAGIGLGDLGQKLTEPDADQAGGQLKVVSRSEGKLLTKLLRTSGAAKILAEPTLVTHNGRPASFMSGGEIPILVPQDEGKVSVEYRRFGTMVDFTPKKQANGKLQLELRVEVTEVDHSNGVTINGTKVPALNTRLFDTTIELESGRTAMLGELSGSNVVVLVTPEFVAPLERVVEGAGKPVRELIARKGMDLHLSKSETAILNFKDRVPRVRVDSPDVEIQKTGFTSPYAPSRRTAATQPQVSPYRPAPAPRTTQASPRYARSQPPQPSVRSLAAKRIPKGMRVVSVRPSEGGKGLTPGDTVDVVSIVLRPEPVAKTLLKGVTVFAMNASSDPYRSPNGGSVSLLVKQGDVNQLDLVAGKILLVPAGDDAEALSRNAAVTAMQLEEASSRAGPNHPRVQELTNHIAAIEQHLSSEAKAKRDAERNEAEKHCGEFEQIIDEVVTGADVDARRLPSGVLLSGTVDDPRHVNLIIQIAEQYFPQVVNNVTVATRTIGDGPFARTAPDPRETFAPTKAANPLANELRELREDVRVLRRDVSRLIEILEDDDGNALQPAPDQDDQSSGTSPDDINKVAWQVIGIRVEESDFKSGKLRGGLKVVDVRLKSPASIQGFRNGDILVGLDKWETIECKGLHFVLSKIDESGQTSVKFHLLRDETVLVGDFKLAFEQGADSTDAVTDPVDPAQTKAEHEQKISQFEAKDIWDVKLEDVISIGLQNSKVIRSLGGVARFKLDGKKQVVLSRQNQDVSLTEFEIAVRHFVSDTEAAYWGLWAAYRNLDTAKEGRDAAQKTWNEIYEKTKAGGGDAQAETPAREQYFFFRNQLEASLKELYTREAKLRFLIGLATSDGRLIRAADKPATDEFKLNRDEAKKSALSNGVELRQQRMAVKQRELQLAATKNQLQPRLDAAGPYKWYGAGDNLNEAGDKAGFELQLPIGFRHEMAGVRNAELQLAREKARLEDMERTVVSLLTKTARDIDFHYRTGQTHLNRWQAAEKEVQSVTKLSKSGKATLDLVLDTQRRRAQARIDYNTAIQEYATAIMDLYFRTGRLLAEHHIAIEGAKEAVAAEASKTSPGSDSAAIPNPTVELKPGDRLTIDSFSDS